MRADIKERIAMIERGEVPEGYKKIKNIIVPYEWEYIKFGDVASIPSGLISPLEEPYCNYIHVGPENIEKDTGRLTNLRMAKELGIFSGKFLFSESAIVYSKIRPNLNKVCMPRFTGICSADCYPIYCNDKVSIEFLFYSILDEQFRKQAVLCSMRTGMPKINQDDLKLLHITIPQEKSEQNRIVSILSEWDQAIGIKEKLLEQKKLQKKGLMERLLTGKVRLPGFTDEWQYVKAGEIFGNSANKKHAGIGEVLSSMQDRGIVPRSQVDIDIKYDADSVTSYKKVEAGDFVISLRSFQGGIEYSEYEGLISPAYTVLKNKTDIDVGFYKELFKSANFIRRLNSVIYGIRDGKQIGYDDFSTLKLPYPPKAEQSAIAKVFQAANDEIAVLQNEITQLKIQKKGLMQLLLTGKVRVPC